MLRIEGDDARGEMDRVIILEISCGGGWCSVDPAEPLDALDVDGETASWIS